MTDPILTIPEDELTITFIRSSGPGGQNVNKVASAAQLRFDVLNSRSLPEEVKQRLVRLAGRRMTSASMDHATSRRPCATARFNSAAPGRRTRIASPLAPSSSRASGTAPACSGTRTFTSRRTSRSANPPPSGQGSRARTDRCRHSCSAIAPRPAAGPRPEVRAYRDAAAG